MRLRPVGVIFAAVVNKGRQLSSSVGDRKGFVCPRQTDGGKGTWGSAFPIPPKIRDRSNYLKTNLGDAGGLNETPMPPTLLLTILGLNV